MKLPPEFIRAKKRISEGLSTQHPTKIVVGLVLGAVLITWTALQVVPKYGNGAGVPVVFERAYTDMDGDRASSWQRYRVAERGDYGEIQNSIVGAPRSIPERVARIENQIDGLLAKSGTIPFKVNTLLNREVKRLDHQIEVMWIEAMADQ